MSDRPLRPDRSFLWLLLPLVAASLPSLLFCALEIALALHGAHASGVLVFHMPPRSPWDRLLALQTSVYGWVAHWNAAVTLAATALFVSALLRPRWRQWVGLVMIPYGLLLCADFTLRWRTALLP